MASFCIINNSNNDYTHLMISVFIHFVLAYQREAKLTSGECHVE